MDAAIGGDALKKRRPPSDAINVGDYIDSWKVIKCEPNSHLSLLFGMKAPGLGRLEFTIKDLGDKRQLDIRAWWHPAGFRGLLYWFAMMPSHLFIFRGMTFALAKKAAQRKLFRCAANQSVLPVTVSGYLAIPPRYRPGCLAKFGTHRDISRSTYSRSLWSTADLSEERFR